MSNQNDFKLDSIAIEALAHAIDSREGAELFVETPDEVIGEDTAHLKRCIRDYLDNVPQGRWELSDTDLEKWIRQNREITPKDKGPLMFNIQQARLMDIHSNDLIPLKRTIEDRKQDVEKLKLAKEVKGLSNEKDYGGALVKLAEAGIEQRKINDIIEAAASDGQTIEVNQIKDITEPATDAPIDLSKYDFAYGRELFPPLIADLADYLARYQGMDTDLGHLLGATVIAEMVIGKRAAFVNDWKTKANGEVIRRHADAQYLNLWINILAKSGGSKTDFVKGVRKLTEAGSFAVRQSSETMASFLSTHGAFISKDDSKDSEKLARLIEEAKRKQKGNRNSINLLWEESRNAVQKLLSDGSNKSGATSNSQLLCSLYEDIGTGDADGTATQGTRVLTDTCINILGFSQPDAWGEEMGRASQISGGLYYRFIPVNVDAVKLTNWKMQHIERETVEDWLAALSRVGDRGQVVIDFDTGDGRDFLGEMRDKLCSKVKEVAYWLEENPAKKDKMLPKALIQGAKIGGIWSICQTVSNAKDYKDFPIDSLSVGEGGVVRINASSPENGYLTGWGMLLAMVCQITTSAHEVAITESGEQLDKLSKLIRKAGKDGITKVDLCRFANLEPYRLEAPLRALEDAGEIARVKSGKGFRFYLAKYIK